MRSRHEHGLGVQRRAQCEHLLRQAIAALPLQAEDDRGLAVGHNDAELADGMPWVQAGVGRSYPAAGEKCYEALWPAWTENPDEGAGAHAGGLQRACVAADFVRYF